MRKVVFFFFFFFIFKKEIFGREEKKEPEKILDSALLHDKFFVDFFYKMEYGLCEEFSFRGEVYVCGNMYKLKTDSSTIVSNGSKVWEIFHKENDLQVCKENSEKNIWIFLKNYKKFCRIANKNFIEENSEFFKIEVLPKKEKLGFELIVFFIEKKGSKLKKIKIFERDGTIHTFNLNKFSKNGDCLFGLNKIKIKDQFKLFKKNFIESSKFLF